MECQAAFRKDFDRIAGITFPHAGITERIPAKCTDFYRVIHDPCMGLDKPDDDQPLDDDTPTDDSEDDPSAGNNVYGKSAAVAAVLFGTAVVLA